MATTISNFSIAEALDSLRTSIPQWNDRLDQLNGQIALRQIELARLEETERPPTRPSLKNRGSTESLRPRDGDENPFQGMEDDSEVIQMNPFEISNPHESGSPIDPSDRSKATGTTPTSTPRPPRTAANARQSPGALKRQSSHHTPQAQGRTGQNVLRKRRPESLASVESVIPKYRTRSMIIVYYDSAVQTAFEELVKFVSGSRNSMRRGKMAAKMAEMKRAAEKEFAEEEEEEDDEDSDSESANVGPKKTVATAELLSTKIKYGSTRNMGPPRDPNQSENTDSPLSVGLLRGTRRGENGDIFDELDKGLEWCQSQCEQGAHRFLREGECEAEIASIKKKLAEVKEVAQREHERLKKEEPPLSPIKSPPRQQRGMPRARGPKKPQPPRAPLVPSPNALEADDDMEVDDEGFDDMELPAKIVFKRSGDIALK